MNYKFKSPHSPEHETRMKDFYNSLNEKDRRHYAALEASRLEHGVITYVAELFGCSRLTIDAGLEELKKKTF